MTARGNNNKYQPITIWRRERERESRTYIIRRLFFCFSSFPVLFHFVSQMDEKGCRRWFAKTVTSRHSHLCDVFAVAEIAEAARQTRTAHTPDLKTKRKKKRICSKKNKRERAADEETQCLVFCLFFKQKRNKVTWRVYNNHVVYMNLQTNEKVVGIRKIAVAKSDGVYFYVGITWCVYALVASRVHSPICATCPIRKLVADFWKPLIVESAKWTSMTIALELSILYLYIRRAATVRITYKPFRISRLYYTILWLHSIVFPREKTTTSVDCPCVAINSIHSLL